MLPLAPNAPASQSLLLLPLPVKVEAFFHLTGNWAYALTVILAGLLVPAISIRAARGWPGALWIDLPLLLLSTASFSAFYLCSQRQVRADWRTTIALIPVALSLGIGLCVNKGRALFTALGHHVAVHVVDLGLAPLGDVLGHRGPPVARAGRGRREHGV